MGNSETTTTHIEIDGHDFALPSSTDVADLMTRIEAAARSEPTFVDLATGDSLTSVLITAHSRVAVYLRRSTTDAPPPVDLRSALDWDL
ncbi:hypothetical protein [Microbacterium sp. K35]|uniref:hypothetical protein n=1 Tax=Microbacterium sp. K35 TaxID=2305440 RepID=UPI00109BE97E|nr:hypothetical protein [Microbacterium sp. K35]MBN6189983.1 hypothetical protein [Aneurinibacillus sp. BA2021]